MNFVVVEQERVAPNVLDVELRSLQSKQLNQIHDTLLTDRRLIENARDRGAL